MVTWAMIGFWGCDGRAVPLSMESDATTEQIIATIIEIAKLKLVDKEGFGIHCVIFLLSLPFSIKKIQNIAKAKKNPATSPHSVMIPFHKVVGDAVTISRYHD